MRLKRILAKDFKRFRDISIEVPETARLIILTGPNGCGKSSLFDALLKWHKECSGLGSLSDEEYYNKTGSSFETNQSHQIVVEFHEGPNLDQQQYRKSVYFRSAHRNDPDVNVDQLRRIGNPLEQVRLYRSIENDAAVTQNYQKLVSRTFDIYSLETPIPTDEFVDSIIAPVRDPIMRMFPDLRLNGLDDPMEDGTFRFSKGTSKRFHFKNLSGGEKAAFDLILDLVIAIETYDDTLFCIDEPEAHMNTRVQAELLSVIFDMIPTNCQLMLATHSIGMMRRAKDIANENPDSVVFLDFTDSNLDERTEIAPTVPNRKFWNNVYEIALDDLANLVAPERVVICEGEPRNKTITRNHAHDARCYEKIFETEFPETQFVPGGNASEVAEDTRGVAYAIGALTSGIEVLRLVDRDDRSTEEIEELRIQDVRVLGRRNLESYLFDDEILRELASSMNKTDLAERILSKKSEICSSRHSDTPGNLKPASGEIYVACKNILKLEYPGDNTKSFMRNSLAPLVRPTTNIYKELKTDIFGIIEGTSIN